MNAKILKFKIEKKKSIVLLTMLTLFASFILGYILLPRENVDDSEETAKEILQDGQIGQSKVMDKATHSPQIKEKSASSGVDSPVIDTIAEAYPFVDSQTNETAADKNMQSTPHATGMGSTTSLPAIPNYSYPAHVPRPNVPKLPATFSAPPASMPLKAPHSQEIQGILTGGSENIAIMSNGKVLKEGDQYMGKDITVINQDGITFSNGNQISYGIK